MQNRIIIIHYNNNILLYTALIINNYGEQLYNVENTLMLTVTTIHGFILGMTGSCSYT